MAAPDPKILSAAPPAPVDTNSSAPAGSAGSPVGGGSHAAPAGAGDLSPTVDQLRAEMIRDRFDSVAARTGIAEEYTDVALALFGKSGQEPTRDNLQKFCAELKKNRPALFGPQPASTAPVPAHAVPAAPAPGGVSNPYQQWQALRAAGRTAEAQAFYMQHRGAITRSA